MLAQIKAEFRKMFTTRSTFGLLLFCVALLILFAFYIEGLHVSKPVTDPHKLFSEITNALNTLVVFYTFVGILLVTHEYRYNTIMYTLTSSNSRFKVLLAKFVAVSIFAVAVTVIFAALSPLLTDLGLHLKGISMVSQSIPYHDIWWRAILFGWGYVTLGFMLAVLIRNQIGAIITLLVFPGTVEFLLGLLLKDNVKYLPFHALNGVLGSTENPQVLLSPNHAAVAVALYLAAIGVLTVLFFQKRDAS